MNTETNLDIRALALRFIQKPRTTRKGIIHDLGLALATDYLIERDWDAIMLARVREAGMVGDLAAHPALKPTQRAGGTP